MGKKHGTALNCTNGQLANLIGSCANALLQAANEISSKDIVFWGTNRDQELRNNFVKLFKSRPDSWYEKDGVIYLSVTSDGTTGEQWISRLESKGYRSSDYAKSILRSPDFKPTSGVTYNIAVLKGELFSDSDRVTKNIRAQAYACTFTPEKLSDPNAEVACLIREKFSDDELKAMGLTWIVAMHEPIKDSVGDPSLLDADRRDDGCWLHAHWGIPGSRWPRDSGFAFVVSQVSA